jgi:glutamyl-tRNA reductase
MIRLVLVGTSHHHAPIELREQVALDRDAAQALAARLAGGGREAVCLSTCNRTELYVAADDAEQAERDAVAALASLEPDVEPALYRLHDRAAALHLFRVAAGSTPRARRGRDPRPGARRARARCDRSGARPGVPSGAPRGSQGAGGDGDRAEPASVSAAAAALAEQVFGSLAGRSILLLGAGKVSEQAARNLRSRGAEISLVANSKTERDRIHERLATVDVVIASTNAPGLVLEAATVVEGLRGRKGRRLVLVDLAVPRDLDPAIGELDGCYLYDIDDLEQIVVETLSLRRREAKRAEAIVAAEAEKFHEWHASLDVVPAIASLRARAEEIRRPSCRRPRRCSGGSTTASAGRSTRLPRRS